jgi:hypothetical protein
MTLACDWIQVVDRRLAIVNTAVKLLASQGGLYSLYLVIGHQSPFL